MTREEPWRERSAAAITIYDGTGPTDFVRGADDEGRTVWQEAEPSPQGRPTRVRKAAPLMNGEDLLEALRGPLGC
jgi:hypothetical protein